ncbi:S1 family peptidase, partial [Streptomyces microflavus]
MRLQLRTTVPPAPAGRSNRPRPPRSSRPGRAYALDAAVERRLGAATAGTYLDRKTGELVVT